MEHPAKARVPMRAERPDVRTRAEDVVVYSAILSADQETLPPAAPHNPPWLFGLLILPGGFTGAVITLLMPYLLRKYGMSVDQIAKILAIAFIPAVWSFLWSPIADTGLRRRTWAFLSALGASLAMAAALLCIHGSPALLTALLFVANAFFGLLTSSCGAIMTAMPVSLRGMAAGWYNAGSVGGGAIGAGVAIWLADHMPLGVLAPAIAAGIVLPGLTAFIIEEPIPVRRALGSRMIFLMQDLRELFLARRTWLGLVFFLSPVGSAAVSNLISGVGPDYHASGNEVLWVTGVAGGLATTVGCFLGSIVGNRMNRMVAYALTGGLTAVCGAFLGLARATPFTYGAGYIGYAITNGLAWAVYTALLLDVVGRRKHAAAAAYSTLNASGNVPISYMTWLDGVGYKHWGARGLMGTDAFSNGVFALVLLMVATLAGHHWHHQGNHGRAASTA